jgi:hypothetical protein
MRAILANEIVFEKGRQHLWLESDSQLITLDFKHLHSISSNLLPWISSISTLFLRLFITHGGIICIFFLKCIFKSLTLLETRIVMLIKRQTMDCLQMGSLGEITCPTLFSMISITTG